jgi:hypothetical protein
MDSSLPIKSSSRAGRFKKKLVSSEDLLLEAPLIMTKMAPLQKLLSGADFAAAYILVYLSHRFPHSWLGAKTGATNVAGPHWRSLPLNFEPNIEKRLEAFNSIYDIFASFALKSTPLSVNRAILNWRNGDYALELMFRIPGPAEVLEQQKNGRRCVTTLVDERISKYILGERDALSFTMHDLIHADHFFHHNECFNGQLGFYGLLGHTINYFDLENTKFASEFEYLISDMNAYAVHLLKCLKSAMIHYFDQDYFMTWLNDLEAPRAIIALNTTDYVPETMDAELLMWLEKFKIK